MKRSKPNEKHCQCYLYLFQTVYMKLKISNHSSFNLKGTGRNPSGKFHFDGQDQQRDKGRFQTLLRESVKFPNIEELFWSCDSAS